jgi:hypothetical protein
LQGAELWREAVPRFKQASAKNTSVVNEDHRRRTQRHAWASYPATLSSA